MTSATKKGRRRVVVLFLQLLTLFLKIKRHAHLQRMLGGD
jgi:hypothetical protein